MTSSSRGTELIPRRWVKARRSDNASGCVEVMVDAGVYRIRDSKNLDRGPVLALSTSDWRALCGLLLAARAPFHQQSVDVRDAQISFHADGRLTMQRLGDHPRDGFTLSFTPFEVECFLDGLRGGEFDPHAPILHSAVTTA